MTNTERIYKITSLIPKGKVLTYGDLAKLAGINNPRVVGNILHYNLNPKIPCHRVVNRAGKVANTYAFGGGKMQAKKLIAEGIKMITDNRVNLSKDLWRPNS